MKWVCVWTEFAEWRCVSLLSSRQESVYLSLQSHLVTLQVLSASPLLQEFIPHLLHLSSRVQTLSSLQSHTVWQQLSSDTVWVSFTTETPAALGESKYQTMHAFTLKESYLIGEQDFPAWQHSTFCCDCQVNSLWTKFVVQKESDSSFCK